MIVSDVGMQLIAEFEGFSGFLYDDPGGHATIGFGFLVHLGNYHRPRGICAKCDAWPRQSERDRWISAEAGRALLRDKVRGYADAVFTYTSVTLTQGQFDALTSLTYNIGAGGFRDSAVRRAVNAGQDPCPAMRKIIYAVGSAMPLPGLVRRREAECALFHSDVPKAQEGRVYTDKQIDEKVGEVLRLGVEANQKADEANRKLDAQATLLEVLIPPLVTGTAAEPQMRYIWAAAKKPWPA
jgi:GH24 family phage-related lysozyme (muramidase)